MTNPISISVSTSLYSSLRFDVESPITLDSDAAHKIVESIKANNSVPSIELLSCYRWDFNATNDSIIQQMILASKQAEIECRSEGDLDNFKSRNREAIACVLEANSCNYSSRQDYYAQELHDAFDFEDIRTALEDEGVEIIEEESDFEDVLFDLLLEAVEEADKSSINCLFGGRRYSAEIVFTPSFNWTEESSEDTDMFVHLDSDGGFTTEGVVELMQMANVGRSELEAYIAESGLELYDGARESLNKIDFEADPTKDKILSPKLTWIVLENAPRGGVPTFTCYVDACEFLNRDITKDMTFSKGVLGLEDTIWGSGHNESIQSDFTIPAGNTNWHMLSKRNIRNEVYCFSISSIKSDIEQK